MNIAYIIQQ
jgi:hypothetical protein